MLYYCYHLKRIQTVRADLSWDSRDGSVFEK